MPNKEMPKNQSPQEKTPPKKLKTDERGDFDIEGREDLQKDSEETDFEVTGRESLVPKKDDFKKSKH